jgi:hypothetical protein
MTPTATALAPIASQAAPPARASRARAAGDLVQYYNTMNAIVRRCYETMCRCWKVEGCAEIGAFTRAARAAGVSFSLEHWCFRLEHALFHPGPPSASRGSDGRA